MCVHVHAHEDERFIGNRTKEGRGVCVTDLVLSCGLQMPFFINDADPCPVHMVSARIG